MSKKRLKKLLWENNDYYNSNCVHSFFIDLCSRTKKIKACVLEPRTNDWTQKTENCAMYAFHRHTYSFTRRSFIGRVRQNNGPHHGISISKVIDRVYLISDNTFSTVRLVGIFAGQFTTHSGAARETEAGSGLVRGPRRSARDTRPSGPINTLFVFCFFSRSSAPVRPPTRYTRCPRDIIF